MIGQVKFRLSKNILGLLVVKSYINSRDRDTGGAPCMNCLRIATMSLIFYKDTAKLRELPYPLSTKKGPALIKLWCLDLIMDVKPPEPDRFTNYVVAVDPFSR